jgi:hypothetical protein
MKSQTGLMIEFQVFDMTGQHIGRGYAIWKDGALYEPTLVSNDGEKLPSDWYSLVHDIQYLIIVPERIQ